MNSANDHVRERLERVRESLNRGLTTVNSLDESTNGSMSFGDDEIFHVSNDDGVHNISNEIPTSMELFDGRKAVRMDSNGDYDLNDLFCKSGRRYEMGLGLNSIGSDVFNLKPVRYRISSHVKRFFCIQTCFRGCLNEMFYFCT